MTNLYQAATSIKRTLAGTLRVAEVSQKIFLQVVNLQTKR